MKKYTGLEIAVIGLAGKFPKADNIEQYWDNLKNGRDCISELSEKEIRKEGEQDAVLRKSNYVKANAFLDSKQYFDPAFFGYRPDEAALMDPQIRIFHECCWEALEDSGYGTMEQADRIGIFATATPNLNWSLYALHKNQERLVDDFSLSQLSDVSFLSSRISYKLNLKGPAIFLQTACSSSLVAIHEACNSLLLGECTMALAGGVTVNNYSKRGYLYEKGMIFSRDGKCRPFDANSDGTVGGEGAGVVVLKRLKDAIRDRDNIYGIIKGTGLNNDGNNKVGYTAPGIEGQVNVIRRAYKMANIEPESISYVEAHGTATELGDVIEIDALNEVYGNRHKNTCAIGSVKSNIGHLDSAAGVAGFIKTVLALKHRQLPPSIHFVQPNPRINFGNGPFYVNSSLQNWENPAGPLRAAISSFGIGGTNAHLILEEAPSNEVNGASRTHQLMVLSAQTKESLSANCDKLLQVLKRDDAPSLADIAYTLNKGRERFKYRKTLVCKDKKEAIDLLSRLNDGAPVTGSHQENIRNVVFMFSGQGSQYREMCKDLYAKEQFFREQLDQCFEIAGNYTGVNLKDILFSEQEPTDTLNSVNNTQYTQPLLFFVEYAMAQLLINWGIKPDYMIGHSIGEYVAACISGVFSLNDAIRLVIRRGELIAGLERGSMLSVGVDKAKLQEILKNFPNVDIAAINSDKAIVVAGTDQDIKLFESYLAQQGYKSKLLNTSHAFHSIMMDGAMADFEKIVSSVTVQEPRIPYVSNLTGELVVWNDLKSPSYWSKHLRHPVQFSKGIKWLAEQGDAVFIEMGPGRSLCSFLNDNAAANAGHLSVNTISQRNQQVDDAKYLLEKMGQLWLAGVKINWDNFYEKEERRRVSLPTYSFERREFTADINAFDLWRHHVSDKAGPTEFRPEDHIHQYHWQIKPITEKGPALTEKNECFLIFSDNEGFAGELAAYLEAHGQKVIMANEGPAFDRTGPATFALNYGNPDDFNALWDGISNMGEIVSQIIYCPAMTSRSVTADYEHINAHLSLGYLGLSYLAKSIATIKYTSEINITVIDNFLAAITEEEEINPLKATIHGPSRVMPLETMNIRCKVIDVSFPYKNGERSEDYLPKIISEIFSTSNEPFVAYRFKQRWVRTFNLLAPEDNTASDISIAKGGTYLLTGGLGGMGLTIADDLVTNHGANVILVHRSAFPDGSEWPGWLTREGLNDEISQKIIRLQQMLDAGSTVQLIRADISDESEVIRLSKEVKKVCSKIDGLIWAAGEIDYGGILANRDRNGLIKSVNSKIHGLLLFEKHFSFGEMSFISLFSSIGNVLYYPKFGQAGYNAANEFLENYSYYLKRKYSIHAFTINWCDWRSVGMTVKARLREAHSDDATLISEQITDGISPWEGVLIFSECLKSRGTVTTIYKEGIAKSIEEQRRTYNDIKAGLQKQTVSPIHRQIDTTSREELLLQLFSGFFGKSEIGMDDDFFELGGDSLMGMTFVARINQLFHTDLSITDIYKYPTARLLLTQFKDGRNENEWAQIPQAPKKNYYQLSSPQRRMYFLQMFDKESVTYNENLIFWLKGNLDKEKFNAAINEIIRRHEILRTSFHFENGIPVQRVLADVDFRVLYNKCGSDDLEDTIASFIRPFELDKGPLMRIGVYEVSEDRHLVIFDMHHIIMDGISKAILVNEFVSLYSGTGLPDPALQYKDYAEWQQSDEQRKLTEVHKAFWLAQFEDEPSILQLPVDFERPAVKNNEGSVTNFLVAAPQVRALKAMAEEEGVSMFMLLLSAYYVLLSKLSNQEDIIVGTPTAGRPHADLENMMGMFVNMVPLRNKPSADLTFSEFLRTVKANSLDFLANQNFQYEELIEAIKMERDLSRNPLFDVVFSHENFKLPEMNMPGLEIDDFNSDSIVSKFDLRLTTVEKADNIYGTFEYSKSLFRSDTIDGFVRHFLQVIHTVIEQRDIKIADIEIVANKERETILNGFNNTAAEFEDKKLITDLFEEQVGRSPFSTAIIAGGVHYSYQWLNEASNRLANLLRSSGVERESSVVVVMERNVELPAVLLAILKAGGKYVPVEPYLPANRVSVILKSVQAKCIITNKYNYQFVGGLLEQTGLPCTAFTVDVQEGASLEANLLERGSLLPVNLYEFGAANPIKVSQSEDLAYIIFTSGSTGDPKGVAVQHKPVINLVEWVNKTYGIDEHDKVLFVTSVSFDLSVYDVFGILAAGGVIRVASRSELEDPDLLAHIIIEEGITFWDSAPAMLQQVLPFLENRKVAAGIKGRLRLAFLSGDWIPLTMPTQMTGIFENLRFIALGGATEATVWSNFFEVKEIDPAWKSIPYGKPIQNARYYILNKSMNVCPVGVAGDLYIGDLCLAKGYFNDPVLSDRKFIQSPFEEGGILYKTGDLARWFPDGNMEFLGRNDSQIKIRGYRIELGEIERKLIEFDGVEQVLVQVFSKTRYDNFVCAFYVSPKPLSEDAMREFLEKDLPVYMVPKFFIPIEKIPVTKNGKIDRKMLPSPELYAKADSIIEPRTAIHRALAETWAELLGIEQPQIGIRDDFFALGGHSIMAVHLINVIKQQFGVGVKLRKIFENSTIEKLAKVIEAGRLDESGSIRKVDDAQTYPVSHAQERLYYAQMLNKDSISHNVYGVYQIKGDVDIDRLEHSFQLLIDRHEGLRTSFVLNPEGLVQRINSHVEFKLQNLESNRLQSLTDAFDGFVEPFDLAAPSLIRCGLLKKDDINLLFVDIHHIVCDGISLNILMNDFKNIYMGNSLAPLPLRYVDYAHWQRNSPAYNEAQKEYWSQQLSGELTEVQLPVMQDSSKIDIQNAVIKTLEITGADVEKIQRVLAASNVSGYMFFLSLFYILLHKVSGNSDIIIGTDVIGRTRDELKDIVGTFINMLPLRLNIDAADSFDVFLDEVKDVVLEGFENQDYQYDQIISDLVLEGRLPRRFIATHFAFVSYFGQPVHLNGLDITPYEQRLKETTEFEFKLEVREAEGKYYLLFVFSEELFSEEVMDMLVSYFDNVMHSVLSQSKICIEDISVEKMVLS